MYREFLRISPIVWTIIIGLLSVIPIKKNGGVSLALDIGHVFVYAILAILWFITLKSSLKAILISAVSTPLTEIVQLIVPWRDANLIDIFNNFTGVLLGCTIFLVLRSFKPMSEAV